MLQSFEEDICEFFASVYVLNYVYLHKKSVILHCPQVIPSIFCFDVGIYASAVGIGSLELLYICIHIEETKAHI